MILNILHTHVTVPIFEFCLSRLLSDVCDSKMKINLFHLIFIYHMYLFSNLLDAKVSNVISKILRHYPLLRHRSGVSKTYPMGDIHQISG